MSSRSDPPDAERSGTRRLTRWLADRTFAAVIAAVVGAIVAAVLVPRLSHDGTSIADQWQHEREALARQGWRVTQVIRVDLKGSGGQSTVLVLHPRIPPCEARTPMPSNEIRVYDVRRGRLTQELSYRPDGASCAAWSFHMISRADLNRDGRADLIGDFARIDVRSQLREVVPVLVEWDDAGQRYQLRTILNKNVKLVRVRARGQTPGYFSLAQEIYRFRVSLGRPAEPSVVLDHFAVIRTPRSGALLAGTRELSSGLARGTEEYVPAVYERLLWLLDFSSGSLRAKHCRLPLAERLFLSDDDSSLDRWTRVAQHVYDTDADCS